MKRARVVTAFLLRNGPQPQVLVLRRSDRVGSYRGKWAGISGYIETESALERALIEIEEETALRPENVRLLAECPPIEIRDEEIDHLWTVYPFLFELSNDAEIRLDWEHFESKWVPPAELQQMSTVPGLAHALESVLNAWHRESPTESEVK